MLADCVMIGDNQTASAVSANKTLSDAVAVEIKPYEGTSPSPQVSSLLLVLVFGAAAAVGIYLLMRKGDKVKN